MEKDLLEWKEKNLDSKLIRNLYRIDENLSVVVLKEHEEISQQMSAIQKMIDSCVEALSNGKSYIKKFNDFKDMLPGYYDSIVNYLKESEKVLDNYLNTIIQRRHETWEKRNVERAKIEEEMSKYTLYFRIDEGKHPELVELNAQAQQLEKCMEEISNEREIIKEQISLACNLYSKLLKSLVF